MGGRGKGVRAVGGALVTAALLLAGCAGKSADTGTGTAETSASPSPAVRSMRDLLTRTSHADSVRFEQTVVYTSGDDEFTETLRGTMDFVHDLARVKVTRKADDGFPDKARDYLLNTRMTGHRAELSSTVLVDGTDVYYQWSGWEGELAKTWLHYEEGDLWPAKAKPLGRFQQSRMPVAGTLLDLLEGGGADPTRGGRAYRTSASVDSAERVLLRGGRVHTDFQKPGEEPEPQVAPVVEVDEAGRIVSVTADVSQMRPGEEAEGILDGVSGIEARLRLWDYDKVPALSLPPRKSVHALAEVITHPRELSAGHCLSLATGMLSPWDGIAVPCDAPHDLRVFAQPAYAAGTARSAAEEQASTLCDRAYDRVPDAWVNEARNERHFTYMWPTEKGWKSMSPPHATCYVLTR